MLLFAKKYMFWGTPTTKHNKHCHLLSLSSIVINFFLFEWAAFLAHSKYKYIFILYYAQFLHTEKKLMTLLTHDTYDTQKIFLKKVAQKFVERTFNVVSLHRI